MDWVEVGWEAVAATPPEESTAVEMERAALAEAAMVAVSPTPLH